MPTHIVQQGEHLPDIAAQYGFSNYRTLWDHPNNAALKNLRENPNVLLPGDEVFIPERQLRVESASTEKRHRFVAEAQPLKLRVKLLDLSEDPIDRSGKATTQAGTQDATPQNHIYEIDIQTTDKDVSLKFESDPPLEVHLAVGSLDPVKAPSGQQERLNNLGYFAGFSEKIDPQQFQWAVEEFQCDRKKRGLLVDGHIDESTANGKNTQKVLEKEHGV
jgi:hypothetical protein